MANRKSALDVTTLSIFGTTYTVDFTDLSISAEQKTVEGKGATEADDWPVLVGRGMKMTADIAIPSTQGTIPMIKEIWTASGATGLGTIVTGFGTIVGTVCLNNGELRVSREAIQTLNCQLQFRGSVTITP